MHFGAEGAKASPAHIAFLFKICLLVVFLHLNGVKGIKSINPPKASDIKLINSWLKMSFCIVILIPF